MIEKETGVKFVNLLKKLGKECDKELRESYVGKAGSEDRWRIVLICRKRQRNPVTMQSSC